MALRYYDALDCGLCVDDLEHCHGTAITDDDTSVCSDDPDCALAPALHSFVVPVNEV
jgi:hypothetical protein